jgi:hypothetical protein
MRSRRSGPGRPSGDTKASGRRVTPKAPLAHVEGGSGRSEVSPTAILQDTHSVEEVFCKVPARHLLTKYQEYANWAMRGCRYDSTILEQSCVRPGGSYFDA